MQCSTEQIPDELPSFDTDDPSIYTREYAESLDKQDPLKEFRKEFIIPTKADLKRKTLAKSGTNDPPHLVSCIY